MTKQKEAKIANLLKFAIGKNTLKRELDFMQGVIEKKSTIPVLSNILIESVDDTGIRITGTDLDVTLRCETEANITAPGSMLVNAKKLFDIVRLSDADELLFAKEENDWVRLTCGKSKFKLAGLGTDQFPETPKNPHTPGRLPAEVFCGFIKNTLCAVTVQQSRFTLSGAKFIISGDTGKMVATDGYRLALAGKRFEQTDLPAIDTLIPKPALAEIVKLAGDSESDVMFGEDANYLYFEIDGRMLAARKLHGNFPNYEMVIPKENDKNVIFNADDLRSAIRRATLFTEGSLRPVKLTMRSNEIEIEARSSEEGEASEKIFAEYTGEETEIGFQSKFLEDLLNLPVITGGESRDVSMSFKNHITQTLFTTPNDENFQYVLVPFRF